MKYIMLSWSQYHELNPFPLAVVCDSREEAEAKTSSYIDKVHGPMPEEVAGEFITAFKNRAYAAWTPNQSVQEREENAGVMEAADKILERLL